MLKGWGTLLDERGHAFLLILGGEGGMEETALEPDAFGQRSLVGPIDCLFGHHDGRSRQLTLLVVGVCCSDHNPRAMTIR